MKKNKWINILCFVCGFVIMLSVNNLLRNPFGGPTNFSDIEYTRPDIAAMDQALEDLYAKLPEAKSADEIMKLFYPYYNYYIDFATDYQFTFIRYSQDMKDIYWEQEYNYCLDQSTAISADYDQLLRKLGTSGHREALEAEEYFGEGFFDDFQGESVLDKEMVALMEQESDLLSRYYELSAQPSSYTDTYFSTTGLKMEEIFLELIALRQQIATQAGYPNYPAFAYEYYHHRDYTTLQAMTYMDGVRDKLAPLLSRLDPGAGDGLYAPCTQEQAFAYVQETAKAMGGTIWESFEVMSRYGVYDIAPGENKYPGSFEVYLYSYGLPFVFVNPQQTARDKLVFTHEFGHFCNDYVSKSTVAGTDVTEIFSQGLEYLSLCYGPKNLALVRGKMAESLEIFITQSVYATFEHRVYGLTGEELTVENVRALYRQTAEEFGAAPAGWDCRDYVMIPHLYSSPLYIVSYVVTNDAAMQLYLLETETKGAGLEIYKDNLATEQESLLGFLKEAGLESPFKIGHLDKIAGALEKALLIRKAA